MLGVYLVDELMGGFYEEPIGIRGEKKGLGLNSSVFCTNLCAVYEPLRCLVFGLCFGVRELFFTLPIDASVNLKIAMLNYLQSSVGTGLANFESLG